ncbi:elongation factor P [uncultured Erythrobacter sp.]|uniref:elongation factor P n=1 Tax=uncultured Erythrobacter sp. TaxID=263913 RepID=UPI0026342CBF|nr:elongation factor P [uncultured Erythrobacter sp.]
MRTFLITLLTVSGAVLATAGPVFSQSEERGGTKQPALPMGGMLRTMPHGVYECALSGDAGGSAYEVVATEGFRISTASRYTDDNGDGTYILRGNRLTFTAGPKNGQRFERVGQNQLRKVDVEGKRSELLCTRLADRRR